MCSRSQGKPVENGKHVRYRSDKLAPNKSISDLGPDRYRSKISPLSLLFRQFAPTRTSKRDGICGREQGCGALGSLAPARAGRGGGGISCLAPPQRNSEPTAHLVPERARASNVPHPTIHPHSTSCGSAHAWGNTRATSTSLVSHVRTRAAGNR